MKGKIWLLFLAAAMTLPAAAGAREGGKGGKGVVRAACKADMDRFCKDIEPGGGRKKECLKAHEAELSAGCKAAIAAKKNDAGKNRPCRADAEKLCGGLTGTERAACMKGHESELSAACKAKREERRAERRERRKKGDKLSEDSGGRSVK